MPAERAPLSSDEEARLVALRSYGILDTEAEDAFDDVTSIAAAICDTPMALVSFVDADRQWFKSRVGLEASETPLDCSICAFGILQPEMLVVADTRRDPRFVNNALVSGDPRLRFYAGAPLITPDGQPLGMLCVLDTRPRLLNQGQLAALQALARQTMAQLELRKALVNSASAVAAVVPERV